MDERLIEPVNYTPEIQACVSCLKYRMASTLADYEETDIHVLRLGDEVYVLANPVLGEEPIYDEFGQVKELVPMRNITFICPQDWLSREGDKLKVKPGRVRVLRPELCIKITADGSVVDGTNPPSVPQDSTSAIDITSALMI